VGALTVRVWRRYGHVRLYVSAGGREVGWYDPRTGRFELAEPGLAAPFWAATLAECDRLLSAGTLTERVLPPAAGPPGGSGPPGDVDPGPAVGERVGEAGPVRENPATGADAAAEERTAPRGDGHWIVRDAEWNDLANSAPGWALRRWLRRQPGVLGPGQVAAVYAAARRPGTWQRPGGPGRRPGGPGQRTGQPGDRPGGPGRRSG
jgi:hypothetical protein